MKMLLMLESLVTPVRQAISAPDAGILACYSDALAGARSLGETAQVRYARSLTTAVAMALWKTHPRSSRCSFDMRSPVVDPPAERSDLVRKFADLLSGLPGFVAGYRLGQFYTSLLPDTVRKPLGAYYTPPPVTDRLLSMVDDTGFDWASGSVLDPACGGAAFLVPVAERMVSALQGKRPGAILESIEKRLRGFEIDPFAAWLAMVLLDLRLMNLVVAAKRPLRPLVRVCNALEVDWDRSPPADLVIGNPPYGRIRLTPAVRRKFDATLFGHANLYGMFTHLAVRLTQPGGCIAFVAPTSFLGGEYFKKLRGFLATEAPPVAVDFIGDRQGVFDQVLQETLLAVFRRSSTAARVAIGVLEVPATSKSAVARPVERMRIRTDGGAPWLLPRHRGQVDLLRKANDMPHRLRDYGYEVSTGQLVWNRHKDQFCKHRKPGSVPVVWAEAVRTDGTFEFAARRRAHAPFFCPRPGQDFLLNRDPCALLQRTTAKEQRRRLIAAFLPAGFIAEHGPFAVENHLNIVRPAGCSAAVRLATIVALLNSRTVDELFRCISGSVAVSAYELLSLPLPDPIQMRRLDKLVTNSSAPVQIESTIAEFYR